MATVTTDKLDYAPGETTTITADGFTAGSTIEFHVEHIGPGPDGLWGTDDDSDYSQTGSGHEPWYVTDGGVGDLDGVENGVIQTTWFVNPDDSLDETFLLTATGDGVDGTFATADDEVATATFTDTLVPSNNIDSLNAWDPNFSGGGWSASGANDFYAEKDVVPFRIALKDVTEGVVYTVVFGLDLNLDVTGALGFSDTALFDTTVTPTLGIGGSLSTATSHNFQATNVGSIGSDFLGFYTSKTNVTLSDGESVSLSPGYQWWEVNFTPDDGDGDVSEIIDLNVVVGGILAGFGDTIKSAGDPAYKFYTTIPSTVPIDLGASQVGGTFQAVLGGVASKTVNFKGSDIVIPPDILITKEIDRDGNGVFESTANINEYSFTIYLDDGDGITEISEGGHDTLTFTQTLNTDASGQVLFVDVEDGTYWITENQENFDVGTYTFAEGVIVDSGLPQGFVGEIAQVTVAGGSSGSGGPQEAEVIYRNELSQGTLGLSFKFHDMDGDGIWDNDGTELGLGGWVIEIFQDSDADGLLDQVDFDLGPVVTRITDDGTIGSVGSYAFGDLDAGFYTVHEVLQDGWTPTVVDNQNIADLDQKTPMHGDITPGTTGLSDNGYAFELIAGAALNNLNFGNFEDFDLTGTKYEDITGDGLTSDDTAWGAGVTIFIDDDGDGVLSEGDRSTTTDANGDYSFSGLTLDDVGLNIYEVVPGGSESTGALLQTIENPDSGGEDADNDFANFKNFSVSGTKYEDITGDGLTSDDTAWGAGVTIFIDDDGDGVLSEGDRSTTTDANGDYSFSGLTLDDVGLNIYEVVPGGSESTGALLQTIENPDSGGEDADNDFANFKNFSVSGTKYEDITGDGLTSDDTAWGAGVTIFIDDDGDGVLSEGDRSTTTDANGDYSFSGLTLDDVGLNIYEVVPGGSESTGALLQTIENPDSGGEDADNDFANFKNFSVSGTKYEDITGDGLTSDDTAWGAGVTIFIDDDGDGVLSEGDRSTTTDANGDYSFSGLTLDDVGLNIYEVVPGGSESTGALLQTIENPDSGGEDADNDFANFKNFSVSGTKYEDITGDGLTSDDTAWGAGVTIFIDDDGDGVLSEGDRSTTTDANGDYSFSGLTLDDVGLNIYEVVPGGSESTGALLQTIENPDSGGEDADNDFANFKNFSVSGTKYEDITGDGLTSDDTAWGAGVTIFIDDDGDGVLSEGDRSTTTDANGDYSFSGLTLDDVGLNIYEVVPGGSESTGALLQTIENPDSGGEDADNDFANFKNFSVSGTKYEDITGDGLTSDDTAWGAGVTIFIDDDGDGVLSEGDRSTTTDANGDYSFSGLTLDDVGLNIYEVVPGGSESTGALLQTIENPDSGGEDADNDFANFKNFSVSGTKYEDITGDGLTSDDTAWGAGVTIFIDDDGDGVLSEGDRSTTTDANGDYSFSGLTLDDVGLNIYEVVPGGSESTGALLQTIENPDSGGEDADNDFANFKNFSVSGTKYEDITGDGLTSDDTAWGAGVTIFIDDDGDGVLSEGDRSTTTDANGDYSFSGLTLDDVGLNIYEVVPGGSESTGALLQTIENPDSGGEDADNDFANFKNFSVSGTKYEDITGDGLTSDDTAWGAGVTIFIDDDGDGVLSEGDRSTTTDANGDYSFSGLTLDDVGLNIYEVVPGGSESTGALLQTIENPDSGGEDADNDFANFKNFSVSGTKYEDITGDGLTSDDTAWGAGVTIFIDDDGDGVLSEGDRSTTTDANGDYSFSGLTLDDVGLNIYEVVPGGSESTGALLQTIENPDSGGEDADNDFANFKNFSVSGTKYEDITGDGLTSDDTAWGAGVTIFIDDDGDGVLSEGDRSTTTDANGDYSFSGLTLDDVGLNIYEVVPGGSESTGALLQTIENPDSGGEDADNDFANFKNFSVSGTKYEDITGDGLTSDDTAWGAGVTIFIDDDGDGVLSEGDRSTTTDANGDYSFSGLTLDDVGLNIYEVVPGGSESTGALLQTIENPDSGGEDADNDFANFKNFSVSGTKYEDITGDGLTSDDTAWGAGVTIFIDDDGDGVLSEGDRSTTTDANGDYSFSGLTLDDVGLNIYEVVPGGSESTGALLQTIENPDSGGEDADNDFANFKNFSVSGTKYEDITGDGLTSDDTAWGAGVTIFIDDDGDGVLSEGDRSTTTDANGDYSFSGLTLDDVGLNIYEVVPGGSESTGALLQTIENPDSGGEDADNDFANFKNFSVSGTKYEDITGDGLTSDDTAWGAGVTIFIDDDGDGVLSEGDRSTTTDANGDYSFSGLTLDDVGLNIYEVVPGGSESTGALLQTIENPDSGGEDADNDFANFKNFSVSGTKYEDITGDGLTSDDTAWGAGVTIFIDDDGDGVLSEGDRSTTTDANGDYSFSGLTLDDVGLNIYEVVPGGSESTGALLQTIENPDSGGEDADNDFANFKNFSVSGTKYEDITGDGLTSDDTAWGAGVTIFIDDDGDGVLSEGDRSTTTDANGDYSFSGLTLDDVGLNIYEVVPGGSESTGALLQTIENPDSGGEDADNDFANFKNFSVSGTKYEDITGDGLTSDDTAWGAGVTIFIDDDGDGVLSEGDRSTTTDANGDYSFSGLTLDDVGLNIYEVVPGGSESTGALLQTIENPDSGGEDADNDFANFKNFSVSGTKYEDITGDGLTSDDTAWGAGVTIFIDDDGDGVLSEGDRSTTTDANGDYSFSGLTLDDVGLNIYEVVPGGSESTGALLQTIENPDSGGEDADNDFANFKNFSVSGTKYEDITGDGLTSDDTAWGAGVTIFIDDDGDGVLSEGDRSTTTDANGDYSFSGLTLDDVGLNIYEVVPGGSESTGALLQTIENPDSGGEDADNDFANFKNFSVSGTKYEDITGDGLTSDDTAWGAGVTIFIDDDGDGVLSEGDRSTTTDANGDYSFSGLTLDDVGLNIYEVVPGGSESTGALLQTIENPDSGGEDADNDFANFKNFSVSGTKYEDITGDGLTSDDTAWGAGVTIFIDDDGDGVLSEGDRSTTTDANGDYSFSGLTLDDVGLNIYEVVPGGSESTGALLQTIENPDSGGEDADNDFANFKNFSVSGTKYEDITGDGLTSDDTAWGAGVTIFIDDDGDGVLSEGDRSTTTDANGDYSFSGLTLDDVGLNIYEVVPGGSESTGALLQTIENPDSGGEDADNDFANFKLFDITGYKWNDADGDGLWDDGEAVIEGWTIYLDSNGDGAADQTATTNSSGLYTFADLGPGSYAITEDTSDTDWANSYNGSTTIVAASGVDHAGTEGTAEALNFGNWTQEGQPSIEVNVLSAEWEAPSPDDNLKHVTGEVLITDESEGGSIPDGFLIAINEFEVSLTSKEGRGKAQVVESVVMYEIVSIDGDVTRAGEGYTPGVDPLIFDESLVLRYIAWAEDDIFNNEDINGDLNVTAEAGIHFRTNKNFLDRESFAENELNAALTLDGDPIKHSLAPDLDEADLQSVVDTVIGYLAELGADAGALEKLEDADLQIKDLSALNDGKTLSYWDGSVITFDDDAAGYGWSDDIGNVNPDRVDLLSSVVHEFGHVLGYDHDVLDPDLAVGERDLPAIDAENVNTWTAGILDEQVDMVGVQDAQIVELVG